MRLYSVQKKEILARLLLEGFSGEASSPVAEPAPWDAKTSVWRCARRVDGKHEDDSSGITCAVAGAENVTVCEGALEGLGGEEDASGTGAVDAFGRSAVPASEYRLGMYIKPVYFISGAVPPSAISLSLENGDIEIFESEERYYVDCLTELIKEKYDEFSLYAVRSMFESLTAAGKMKKRVNGDYIIFTDEDGKNYPICRHFANDGRE
ncbi:MAG: hypothetical protein J6U38_05900 [Clostridia bacterium]|jgi:hypothetical protein|nr:hypothetical protein [Clostridia bacterium]MBO7398102.1 hypothetical protein [Clostridia bacterium]MBO7503882.1 hypothetical protein [Clostridia bacterium]MBO7659663.1 hypothetical protein [Clostridia bacterium]MBR5007017.1 hypothetical protein [Clostridia bacterium]